MSKRYSTLFVFTLGLLIFLGQVAVAANPQQSMEKPYNGRVFLSSTLFPQTNNDTQIAYRLKVDNQLEVPVIDPPPVKGIYVTGWMVGSESRMNELIDLARNTEINAFVIDVKDDSGTISWMSDVQLAVDVKANRLKHKDFKGLIQRLKDEDIYLIGRVVAFKDALLTRARPERALVLQNGEKAWADDDWLSPFNQENWDYVIALSKEAAEMGFDEIQFDYVRFPALGNGATQVAKDDIMSKDEAINTFLARARKELGEYGVPISADVFGMVTTVKDLGIGQNLEKISEVVDVLSPMIYPSHYSNGNFKLPSPEQAPYETIFYSMKDALNRIPSDHPIRFRPWLQDFSMRYAYGPHEVREQIQALDDLGIKEWLLWNPRSNYTKEALLTDLDGFRVSSNSLRDTVLFND